MLENDQTLAAMAEARSAEYPSPPDLPLELHPAGLRPFGVAVRRVSPYLVVGRELQHPTASPLFNYTFARQDHLLKFDPP